MNDRYCRQISLIGKEGQERLKNSSVLLIGAGGIGSPLSMYLAGSGVGKLGIIDFDTVELSNLHRQILFDETMVGKPKAQEGAKRLKKINSKIRLSIHNVALDEVNAETILKQYDLIIDGSDNFKTRYLANDMCCRLALPLISTSIFQSQIQVLTTDSKTSCYRCMFPEPPPPNLVQDCTVSGVLGATAGIAGSLAASIAIRILSTAEESLFGQLLLFDCKTYSSEIIKFRMNSTCPACKHHNLLWPAISFGISINDIRLSDYLVVDIRELDESRINLLTNKQIHIPFSQLISSTPYLPKKKILLYCSHGNRSDYACYILRKAGYDAHSLKYGVEGI